MFGTQKSGPGLRRLGVAKLRLDDPRGKEEKIKDNVLANRKPRCVPEAGGVPDAVGGAEILRIVAPGTAAEDPATAISGCPGRAIRGRPL